MQHNPVKTREEREDLHAVEMAKLAERYEAKFGCELMDEVQRFYFYNLEELYQNRGWVIGEVLTNYPLLSNYISQYIEVDMLNLNPDFIIATEIQLTLNCQQVDTYVSKLPIIKQYMAQNGLHQPLFGAIGYIKKHQDKQDNTSQPHSGVSVLEYAEQEHGLYTVEILAHTAWFYGETGKDDFKPKIYTN